VLYGHPESAGYWYFITVSMNRICRFEKLGLVVVVASLLACCVAKGTSSVDLQWNPNTDPSVTGYNVYYGDASRTYTNVISVGNTTNTSLGGLLEGKTYFFAVTAYDDSGDESDYSDETVYIVPGLLILTPGATPGAPVHLQFPVAPNHWYELQSSADLQTWTTIWQITGVTNNWIEFDPPVIGTGPHFYRLILH
jgi:hypothetical protein